MSKNTKSVAILLALCAVMTAFAAGGCRKIETPEDLSKDTQIGSVDAPEEMNAPALRIETTDEDSKWVTVGTTYGAFRYSSAFSDIIAVTAVQHDAASNLLFTADIDGKEILLYTIRYNEDGKGIALGTLKLSDQAATMPVSVSFGDAPNGLAGNELATFIAAQETFNDVLTSMMEDSRFTMAE